MDTSQPRDFNVAADVIHGVICCLCFFVGTLGNIFSFLHFKSKSKKDMSTTVYMLITATDTIISVAILPVGVSYLTQRSEGLLFKNKHSCEAWWYFFATSVAYSIFLVMCLSTTRTISLVMPFYKMKKRFLAILLLPQIVIQIAQITVFNLTDGLNIEFKKESPFCDIYIDDKTADRTVLTLLHLGYNVAFTASAVVVATSCIISTIILTRRNRHLPQQEVQKSKNRATATILLFALLYGVCNVPVIVYIIGETYKFSSNNEQRFEIWYQFDEQKYFYNAINTVIFAVNSAANPILYFWRMPRLRENMKRMLKLKTTQVGAERNQQHNR